MVPKLESDAVAIFARECQLAAGLFVESPLPTELLKALQSALRAVPDTLSPTTVPIVSCILCALMKRIHSEAQHPPPPNARRVDQVASHILTSYADQPVTLVGVARQFGVTSDHLSRLIRGATGAGFLDHLRSLRIVHVMSLLAATDSPVGALALSAGYRQASHLDRHFKAALHLGPSRFRKLCRSTRAIRPRP